MRMLQGRICCLWGAWFLIFAYCFSMFVWCIHFMFQPTDVYISINGFFFPPQAFCGAASDEVSSVATVVRTDSAPSAATAGTFTIVGDDFVKDGKPFRILSGSIHYWRVLPPDWGHHFRLLKQMGLNTITTYINWALHEPSPGKIARPYILT